MNLKKDFVAGNNPRLQELPQVMKPTVKVIPATSKSIVKGFDVNATENIDNLTIQSQNLNVDRNQDSIFKEDTNRKDKRQTTVANLVRKFIIKIDYYLFI
jgi:hypothetical protein